MRPGRPAYSQEDRTMPRRRYLTDLGVWLFGSLAIAALAVSWPATFAFVQAVHSDGSTPGLIAAIALLVILELGAVTAKLATLAVPDASRALNVFTYAFLAMTTLANLIHGAATFAAARDLDPALAAVRNHPVGFWLVCIGYAGTIPFLIGASLQLLVRRCETLRGERSDAARQVAAAMQPMRIATAYVQELHAALQCLPGSALPALPPAPLAPGLPWPDSAAPGMSAQNAQGWHTTDQSPGMLAPATPGALWHASAPTEQSHAASMPASADRSHAAMPRAVDHSHAMPAPGAADSLSHAGVSTVWSHAAASPTSADRSHVIPLHATETTMPQASTTP